MIDVYTLKTLVEYDPETGFFTWLVRAGPVHVGDVAGNPCHGYWQICIDRRRYYAHRLAWLYMTGEWPKKQIDHINLDKADNRWRNLRLATPSQNICNQGHRITSRLGLKGVYPNGKRFAAQITIDGICHHLGTFDTPELAHSAYVDAADVLHGTFARAK
jgi:hypothetical protein